MTRPPQRRRRARGLTRRHFLTGAAGVTLALPWLEKIDGVKRGHAQTLPERPKRVIVMAYPMGVPLGQWRPDASLALPFVTAPLEPFKQRCLFVSAIDNRVLDAGGNLFVFGHPGKKEAALTGTLTTGAFPTTNGNHIDEVRADAEDTGGANGPSVEHVIGEFLYDGHARHSVDLAVDGNTLVAWYDNPASLNSDFFFEGRANAISLNPKPRAAFDQLFASLQQSGPSEAELERTRLRTRNKSVLDAVRASFGELRQGLGRDDQRRLDEHAARIRQLELDVQLSASCSAPTGIEAVADYRGYTMDQLAPLQNRILAHAMACDIAPVGRIEFKNQQNPRFGIPELDGALDAVTEFDWHGMVHGDPLPGETQYLRPGRDDTVTSYDSRLLAGYRFFVEQFADLLAQLDSIPEGPEGSALDHSLVILASDLGEGLGHGHMKMGYILAGNLGGARRGFHLDAGPAGKPFQIGGGYYYDESRYNVSQLLNSVLDMTGTLDAQGNPVTIGLQGYLEQAGLPRRIDELFG